ncbi:MAG TPA: nicotinate-nucleotide--dimethylbenzimidazole phosphoribosyltransferase [Spirochaetota bacterium]|nr:nicotinate-nucleotide--dimethylbenzimidazole phosphoribosyltransferase [Spirochaetota bacterium]
MKLDEILAGIKETDKTILSKAEDKINNKTKPLGALGVLEDIAIKMSLIQQNLNPIINKKLICVFAGDHGITKEGVSAFPSEVTPQMVYNFLNGGAAINVLTRHNNIDIKVVDMGVNYDFGSVKGLINKKVAKGTKNFLNEAAMSYTEAVKSIEYGFEVFTELYNQEKIDLYGTGDMGIGNTTSSSAIISVITGALPSETTGRGTGINDESLKVKIKIITDALKKHNPDKNDPIDILLKVGGFEIGGIAGSILGACYHKVPVVLDGIISTAAGLIAYSLKREVSDYLFSGHRSVEKGQTYALKHLNIRPLIDLDLRLGEGTGSALAMNIIEAGCKIMSEMSSFDDANVSKN